MGSPKPTVITPPPPTVYISSNPKESYQMTGDFLNRLQRQTNTAQQQLYAQSGTPGEIGARQAGTRMQAAGAYLSSLPTGDKYTRANSGVSDQYAPVRESSQTAYSEAQKDYADALARSTQAPAPAYTDEDMATPSWAKSTIPEGMPGYREAQEAKQEVDKQPVKDSSKRDFYASNDAFGSPRRLG